MNQTLSNVNKWLVCPRVHPNAESRLFIFPFAGGGPAAFAEWSAKFPDHIEVWAIHYPGRGSRYNDHPVNNLDILVENIHRSIQPLLDKPFAFFGHSLGGLVAFELARSLKRYNLSQPNILFVSACGAPQLPDPNPPIHALPDSQFVKALVELNGTPKEIATNPELLEILLPTLRADFEAAESYRYNPGQHSLACPMISFGGDNDPRVSRERMEAWATQTSSRFKSIYFPGDHFYLNSVQDKIVQSIKREIMYSLEGDHKPGQYSV